MTTNKKPAPGGTGAGSRLRSTARHSTATNPLKGGSPWPATSKLRAIGNRNADGNERHVDGLRTRQKMFRICPRQRGVIDPTLAGLIAGGNP